MWGELGLPRALWGRVEDGGCERVHEAELCLPVCLSVGDTQGRRKCPPSSHLGGLGSARACCGFTQAAPRRSQRADRVRGNGGGWWCRKKPQSQSRD